MKYIKQSMLSWIIHELLIYAEMLYYSNFNGIWKIYNDLLFFMSAKFSIWNMVRLCAYKRHFECLPLCILMIIIQDLNTFLLSWVYFFLYITKVGWCGYKQNKPTWTYNFAWRMWLYSEEDVLKLVHEYNQCVISNVY